MYMIWSAEADLVVIADAEGPYVIQAVLFWDSVAAFDAAAVGEGGPEVFADVPNFTDIKPVPLKGEIKGAWSG